MTVLECVSKYNNNSCLCDWFRRFGSSECVVVFVFTIMFKSLFELGVLKATSRNAIALSIKI